MELTIAAAKSAAKILHAELGKQDPSLTHSRALEIVAHQLGLADWNTAAATLAAGSGPAIPILRIQDERIARGFYLDYLGFTVEWEHRFEPSMPLYTRLSRSGTTIDLSEHHGDGTPGTAIWIPVADLRALHGALSRNSHSRVRPGIDKDSPGGPTMSVTDPFGNELRFCQPHAE